MTFLRRGVPALALVCFLALVPAGLSLASGTDKPDAQTQDATQITSTAAKLNGKVKPRGLATTWWFEYGTSKSYGQSTLPQVGLMGSDWASVVANISGLQPNTTYHYRVVASNLLGDKDGGDKSFKTAKTGGSSDNSGSGSSGGGGSGSGSGSGSGDSGSGDSSGSGSGDSSGSGSGDNSGSGSSSSGSSGAGSDSGSGAGNGSGSSGDDSRPELGKTVSVEPQEGTVRVREPGKSRWDAVDPTGTLPTGTVVDATKGKITLTTALPAGKTQSATFWGGMFEVRQDKRGRGYTDIHLRGASLAGCPAKGTKRLATASKKKRKRGLWGSDKHGRYRTHGRNSVATVRGTTWLTTDSCSGTLTFVRDGAVAVRDKHRHKTVLVRAGHAYLARGRR